MRLWSTWYICNQNAVWEGSYSIVKMNHSCDIWANERCQFPHVMHTSIAILVVISVFTVPILKHRNFSIVHKSLTTFSFSFFYHYIQFCFLIIICLFIYGVNFYTSLRIFFCFQIATCSLWKYMLGFVCLSILFLRFHI